MNDAFSRTRCGFNRVMLCVIILNWQTFWHTNQNLKQLAKWVNARKIDLILCDNGSTNDSLAEICSHLFSLDMKFTVRHVEASLVASSNESVSERHTPVTLLVQRENLGYGAGNNRAFTVAVKRKRYHACLILNNDCLIEDSLAEMLFNDPPKSLNGGQIYGFPTLSTEFVGQLVNAGGGHYFFYTSINYEPLRNQSLSQLARQSVHLNYISGASLWVPLTESTPETLFDERYFLYCEEIDLFQRLRLTAQLDRRGVIFHKTAGSTRLIHQTAPPRYCRQYFENYSAYLFAATQKTPFALLLTLALRLLIKPLKLGVLQRQKRDFFAFWLATWDFLIRHCSSR